MDSIGAGHNELDATVPCPHPGHPLIPPDVTQHLEGGGCEVLYNRVPLDACKALGGGGGRNVVAFMAENRQPELGGAEGDDDGGGTSTGRDAASTVDVGDGQRHRGSRSGWEVSLGGRYCKDGFNHLVVDRVEVGSASVSISRLFF